MAGVGRDLWDTLVQPPPKAGRPRAAYTGSHPAGFSISPEKETPQLLWQPVALLCQPHSKENFPHIHMELSMFQFLPIAIFLSLGTVEKSLTYGKVQFAHDS